MREYHGAIGIDEKSSLPTSESYIRRCLAGTSCTRIFLWPVMCRGSSEIAALLTRNGQNFCTGNESRGRIEWYDNSFPTIDLAKMGELQRTEEVSLEKILSGNLPPEAEQRISKSLQDVRLYLRPKNPDCSLEFGRVHDLMLFAPDGVPDWLIGIGGLRIAGDWSACIDPRSHEWKVIDALTAFEARQTYIKRDIERIKGLAGDIRKTKKELPELEAAAKALIAEEVTAVK